MDNKILIAIVAVALIAVAAVAVFTFSGDSEDVPSDAVRYKETAEPWKVVRNTTIIKVLRLQTVSLPRTVTIL